MTYQPGLYKALAKLQVDLTETVEQLTVDVMARLNRQQNMLTNNRDGMVVNMAATGRTRHGNAEVWKGLAEVSQRLSTAHRLFAAARRARRSGRRFRRREEQWWAMTRSTDR